MRFLTILIATMAAAIGLGSGCRTMEGGGGEPALKRINENDVRNLLEKVFAASQRKDLGPILPSLTDDFTMVSRDPDLPKPIVVPKKDYGEVLLKSWRESARVCTDVGSEIVDMRVKVSDDGQSAEAMRHMRSWYTRNDTGVKKVTSSEFRNQFRIERGVLRISRLEILGEPSGLSSTSAGRANDGL